MGRKLICWHMDDSIMGQINATITIASMTNAEIKDYLAASFDYDRNNANNESKADYNDRMLKVLLKGQIADGRRKLKHQQADAELPDFVAT